MDLHINCWIFGKGHDAIDFGLMLSKAVQNDTVYFYVPFQIKEENVINLTKIIQTDESIRSIIFNEEVYADERLSTAPNCKFYTRENGDVFSFCLSEIEHEPNYQNGTLLTFNILGDTKEKLTYFRFRLKNISDGKIFKRSERQVSALTGINEDHINIEININQFRKLCTTLKTKIHQSKSIFNRINMFLIADIDLTPIFSTHTERPKTRTLEDAEQWKRYMEVQNNDRYLAYQYKKEILETDNGETTRKLFHDFTIFSKFEQVKATQFIKSKAFIFLTAIGLLSSIIVTYGFNYYNAHSESIELTKIKGLEHIALDNNKSIVSINNELHIVKNLVNAGSDTLLSIKDDLNTFKNDGVNTKPLKEITHNKQGKRDVLSVKKDSHTLIKEKQK